MLNRDVGGVSQALRNNEAGIRGQPAITAIAIKPPGLATTRFPSVCFRKTVTGSFWPL